MAFHYVNEVNVKAIYTFEDEHTGKIYVLLPKIREVATALGNIVITYDNGDRKSFDVANLRQTVEHLLQSIENYYADLLK
jgi:uncharacterized protein YrzB (UPF0473 family)